MRKLALGILLVTACARETPTAAAVSVAGQWGLHSVAGATLPLMVARAVDNATDLVSDMVTLETDGTYSETTLLQQTAGGKVTLQSFLGTGTYTVDGGTITMRTPDGVVTVGAWDRDAMTLKEGGHAFVYHRR